MFLKPEPLWKHVFANTILPTLGEKNHTALGDYINDYYKIVIKNL